MLSYGLVVDFCAEQIANNKMKKIANEYHHIIIY